MGPMAVTTVHWRQYIEIIMNNNSLQRLLYSRNPLYITYITMIEYLYKVSHFSFGVLPSSPIRLRVFTVARSYPQLSPPTGNMLWTRSFKHWDGVRARTYHKSNRSRTMLTLLHSSLLELVVLLRNYHSGVLLFKFSSWSVLRCSLYEFKQVNKLHVSLWCFFVRMC